MLDLETFGTRPGCIIRSIGAVAFDPDSGQMGDEFYAVLSEKEQKKLKMKKDDQTVAWWAKPDQAYANEQLTNAPDKLEITEALNRFKNFVRGTARTQFIWSQGANFDEPVLAEAYDRIGIEPPWKFWDSRCTRTIYAEAGFNFKSEPREGTYHNALDDARHQVRCVYRARCMIKGRVL